MSRYLVEKRIYAITPKEYKKCCSLGYFGTLLERCLPPIFEDTSIENWTLVQPDKQLKEKRRQFVNDLYSCLCKDNNIKSLYKSNNGHGLFSPMNNIYYRIYVQITPLDEKRKIGDMGNADTFLKDYELEAVTDRSPVGKKRQISK